MKKYKQFASGLAISELRIETSGFESTSDCPKDGGEQVDDFHASQAKQWPSSWRPKQVQSLCDERKQACINGT